jgi:NitT/TauT family transport system permease protein
MRERVVSILSPLALLVLWEALVRTRVLDVRFFPGPSQVLGTLVSLNLSGELPQDLLVSLARIATGFAPGGSAGIALGS